MCSDDNPFIGHLDAQIFLNQVAQPLPDPHNNVQGLNQFLSQKNKNNRQTSVYDHKSCLCLDNVKAIS